MVNGFAPSWARVGGKALLPASAVLPGRVRPVKAAWPQSAGHPARLSGAARPSPGAPDRRAAPPPAATVQLRLLLSSRRQEPDTAAALGRSQLRGIGVATPVLWVSARDPPGPAAPSRSSALTAGTTSSSSPAARSAPAPAPPLRGVLSRGPRSACAGVPKRSCPQVPPPAPPSLPRRGWEQGRVSALGLQSFSSRCCSRNKRGGGVEDQ